MHFLWDLFPKDLRRNSRYEFLFRVFFLNSVWPFSYPAYVLFQPLLGVSQCLGHSFSCLVYHLYSSYGQEGLNEVTRQSSSDLKINRQPSREVIFYLQASKMQNKMNDRQKVSRHFKSHSVSADLYGILVPEKSPNWKNQLPCSHVLSFETLQYLRTCLCLKIFRNFMSERPRQTPRPNSWFIKR